jgi:hydrogenase expression/formation protein HypE
MVQKLNFKSGVVDLSMGAGGQAMHGLIEQLICQYFDNAYINQLEDQAILPAIKGQLAMTTDSYTVTPYFFPGGDIGSLAVYGTVNDLAVGGAEPLYLSVGFILEEGLPLADLEAIVSSMAKAAKQAQVYIVTGDTKVVEQGKGDGIFINTTGIGNLQDHFVSGERPEKGDSIIINGNIGEHGIAVMSKRPSFTFECDVESDATPLHTLTTWIRDKGCKVKLMRDPTRGGVAATLNEWAHRYQLGIHIDESRLPISKKVQSACELLGLDPLFIANEGKILIVCDPIYTKKVLRCLHSHTLGKNARVIATIEDIYLPQAKVTMTTSLGGKRRVDWLSGEQLPRIC